MFLHRGIVFAFDDHIEVHASGRMTSLAYPTRYQHTIVDQLGGVGLTTGATAVRMEAT